MAKTPSEPPSKSPQRYIKTPLQKYYGIHDTVMWPQIFLMIGAVAKAGVSALL